MAWDMEELEEDLHEAIGFLEEGSAPSRGRRQRRWRLSPISATVVGLAAVGLLALAARPAARSPGAASSRLDTLGAYGLQKKPYTGEELYNLKLAKVFAMFSKLSYCGPLPGILGSVAYSCGQTGLPGVVTECEDAGLVVYPGLVRMVVATDLDVYSSVFGFVARFHQLDNSSRTGIHREACIATFRGSIDNFANSVRDKQTDLTESHFKDCDGCKVHAGYSYVWSKIKKPLLDELKDLGCDQSIPLYFTGHGSGSAIAALGMYDMAMDGYAVAASYIYESPLQGNLEFAQSFYDNVIQGMKAPLFSVKYASDAVTRWPKGSDWYSVGLEVYFAEDLKEGQMPDFCGPSMQASGDCGMMAQHPGALTAGDTCPSPLAPEKNFCQFSNFAAACYGGIGFESKAYEPWRGSDGSPTSADEGESAGKPEESLHHHGVKAPHKAVGVNISKSFDPAMAEALAALTKLTYCGQQPGIYASVVSTCRSFCKGAGFEIIPGTVRSAGLSDNATAGAISFYVAKFKRTNHEANMPEAGCVLAIRGSGGKSKAYTDANDARSNQTSLVTLNGTKCSGCKAHEGFLSVWEKVQDRAVDELRSIGCTAGDKWPLFLTGHSMGGAVAEIGMYYMKELGFAVEASYTFGAESVGNEAFGEALNSLYENNVGLFRVTHANDSAPRAPATEGGYANVGHEVYVGSRADEYTVCQAGDRHCGLTQYNRSALRDSALCSSPFAPSGDLCSLGSDVCMRGKQLPGKPEQFEKPANNSAEPSAAGKLDKSDKSDDESGDTPTGKSSHKSDD